MGNDEKHFIEASVSIPLLDGAFDQKTDFMIFCAFRYCLGRMTYAVSICADYLTAHWRKLHPDTQKMIHQEIQKAFERSEYGHECDYEDWQRVLSMPLAGTE